jgi:hypothetical protein
MTPDATAIPSGIPSLPLIIRNAINVTGPTNRERFAECGRSHDRQPFASRAPHFGQTLGVQLPPAPTKEAGQTERDHVVRVLPLSRHLGQVHAPAVDRRQSRPDRPVQPLVVARGYGILERS